jgi:molybdenum cofactor synthesis domain-containing protein
MTHTSPTAALLIIGNEILSGRTQDANLQYLANGLNGIGIRFMEARVVPDIESMIVEAVNALRHKYTYVFTTGGIGPTHDDITAAAIAKAFSVPIIRHPDAVSALSRFYADSELNEARLKMADVPKGSVLVENAISSAPGFRMGNVYVLAGIPRIMQVMFEAAKNDLAHGPIVQSRELSAHLSESKIAKDLTELQTKYPETDIGSYPFTTGEQYGVTIVIRSENVSKLDEAFHDLQALFKKHGA